MFAQPSKRIPKDGDRAYSKYHGSEWVGVLFDMHNNRQGTGKLKIDGKHYPLRYQDWISVGYDEPLEWDDQRQMWNAPADSD